MRWKRVQRLWTRSVHVASFSAFALVNCGTPERETAGFITQALCQGIQVSFSPTGPSPAGSSIALSASAACSVGETAQYRFSYRREGGGSAWTEFRGWSTVANATWNTASPTALPTGHYRFSVEVRPVGSTSQSTRNNLYYSLGTNCASGSGTPGSGAFCATCICTTGQGDCDGNDCAAGLVCGDNQGNKFGFSAATDVCVPQHCTNNVQDSAAGETGLDCGGTCGSCQTTCAGALGADDFCVGCTCESGQGDCDSDTECALGLICGTDNGNQFGFGASTDACAPPHCQNNTQDSSVGEAGIDCGGACGQCLPLCSGTSGGEDFCVGCRCDIGQGDCDGDAECARGLICGSNNGPEFGLPAGFDVCIGSGAVDVLPGTVEPATPLNTAFTYDALGRLTGLAQNGTTLQGYGYDRAGNRCIVSNGPVAESNGYCPGNTGNEHYTSAWDSAEAASYSDPDGTFTLTWTTLPGTTGLWLHHRPPPGQPEIVTEVTGTDRRSYSGVASGLHVFTLTACITEWAQNNIDQLTTCQNSLKFNITVN